MTGLINYQVVDERLSRSGEIMAAGPGVLKELGINTVICLKDKDKYPEVQAERLSVEAAGLMFFWRPMKNQGIFSYHDIDKVDGILHLIGQAPGRVLVHCHKGRDRSSVVCAAYRIAAGWSVEDAIKEGQSFKWAWWNRGQRSAVKKWAKNRLESK